VADSLQLNEHKVFSPKTKFKQDDDTKTGLELDYVFVKVDNNVDNACAIRALGASLLMNGEHYHYKDLLNLFISLGYKENHFTSNKLVSQVAAFLGKRLVIINEIDDSVRLSCYKPDDLSCRDVVCVGIWGTHAYGIATFQIFDATTG
jgi:hypothetical protein